MRLNCDYMDLDSLFEQFQEKVPDCEKLTRNEVKRFEAIFSRLAEVNNGGWASVKDRLPVIEEGCEGILVCDANKNVHLTHALIYMEIDGSILYFDDSHSDCYWSIVGGKKPEYNTLIKGNEITHWMPMPEPPKEDEE